MIRGFLTDESTAAAISAGVAAAQDVRGVARYLSAAAMPVLSGPYAGIMFLPFEDSAMEQERHGGLHLADFPEFDQLVGMLGGLESRIVIDPSVIVGPEETP